jgi:hypothetical protein
LLTVVVVASGFIGRYIYTAVPRTVDGVEVEASFLEAQISDADTALQGWLEAQPEGTRLLARRLVTSPLAEGNALVMLAVRPFSDWGFRLRWWLEKQRLQTEARLQANQLENMVRRQRLLKRQVATLAMARRLLAVWHAVHIPVGMALFTAAFIHIGAAIYYATLLR